MAHRPSAASSRSVPSKLLETHPHLLAALHAGVVFGDRQAAFFLAALPLAGNDLGIDGDQRRLLAVPGGAVEDDQPLADPDLGRGEADAGGGVHGLQHVVGQAAQFGVEGRDRCGLLLEDRIGVVVNAQNGHPLLLKTTAGKIRPSG